jgi:hypothetical protein
MSLSPRQMKIVLAAANSRFGHLNRKELHSVAERAFNQKMTFSLPKRCRDHASHFIDPPDRTECNTSKGQTSHVDAEMEETRRDRGGRYEDKSDGNRRIAGRRRQRGGRARHRTIGASVAVTLSRIGTRECCVIRASSGSNRPLSCPASHRTPFARGGQPARSRSSNVGTCAMPNVDVSSSSAKVSSLANVCCGYLSATVA